MIKAILYNISAYIIVTLCWVSAFLAGQQIQAFPRFAVLAILLMFTAFIVFLFINITIFKKHKWWLRVLCSSFLSLVFTIIWHLTNFFAVAIVCNRLRIPLQSYIKEMMPLTRFFTNVDNSPISGLIFAFLFLTFVFFWWYWVLFKNGANIWSRGIFRSTNKLRFSTNNFMAHPLAVKIAASIMLMASFFGVYAALMSLIKKM
jgi:hypothetical protein